MHYYNAIKQTSVAPKSQKLEKGDFSSDTEYLNVGSHIHGVRCVVDNCTIGGRIIKIKVIFKTFKTI